MPDPESYHSRGIEVVDNFFAMTIGTLNSKWFAISFYSQVEADQCS